MPLPAIIPAIGAIAGSVMGMSSASQKNSRQLELQRGLNEQAMESNKQMAIFNNKLQKELWRETGPSGQVKELKRAGLNPALLYGMGGAGGQTAAAAQAQGVSGGTAQQDNIGENIAAMGMQLANQVNLMQAQKENIEADTELKKKAAGKTVVDTELGELEKIIKDVAGQDAKSKWENVTKPNRGQEGKTASEELAARQGVAMNIWDLYTEGKLKDKSLAEIEAVMASGAKSREEIKRISKDIDLMEAKLKGENLENAIKEIELKLQEATGLDKNSPYWAKMLGRLLTKWFNLGGE